MIKSLFSYQTGTSLSDCHFYPVILQPILCLGVSPTCTVFPLKTFHSSSIQRRRHLEQLILLFRKVEEGYLTWSIMCNYTNVAFSVKLKLSGDDKTLFLTQDQPPSASSIMQVCLFERFTCRGWRSGGWLHLLPQTRMH